MKLTRTRQPLPDESWQVLAPVPLRGSPALQLGKDEEFRLITELRDAAKTQDAKEILVRAGVAYYHAEHRLAPPAVNEDLEFGNALADLAVTGRMAYKSFNASPPDEASLM